MNRKLKKMLKDTYKVKPERKSSFLHQLRNNPVWRRLHPVSSLIKMPPSYIIIPAAAAAALIGAGIAVFNLTGGDNKNTLPDDSSAVMEAVETALPQTDEFIQFTAPSTGIKVTVTAESTEKKIVSTEKSGEYVPAGNIYPSTSKTTEKISTYTTVTASVTESETTAAESVYYTHLFDHVQNIDDLRRHYDDIKNNQNLYGYPDYNYFEDMLRLMCEEWGQDFDELYKDFESYLSNNLSFEVLNNVISMKEPPIIEGKTVGIEYAAYEGKPWTVCEVLVSEVYNYDAKHIFNRGDRVKIAMPGGYMSAREYIRLNPDSKIFSGWTDKEIDAATIYEEGSNQNEPKIGDVFTYIISYDDFIPGFPVSGCLTRFSFNDMAQFTRNGDTFTSCNSNFKDMYFKLDQVNNSLFEFTDIIHDPGSGRSLGIKNNCFLMYGEFDCYSISEDGKIKYLGGCSTDNGFYPFHDENNYNITWTEDGVIIEYRSDNMADIFYTKKFSY